MGVCVCVGGGGWGGVRVGGRGGKQQCSARRHARHGACCLLLLPSHRTHAPGGVAASKKMVPAAGACDRAGRAGRGGWGAAHARLGAPNPASVRQGGWEHAARPTHPP